jgi:hypothetical protein
MNCIGYILRGVVPESGISPIDIEEQPDSFNIDIMIAEEDGGISYLFPIWEMEDGMPEEMAELCSDHQSMFPDNPLFIKYYDKDIDELHILFHEPEHLTRAIFLLSDIDAEGNPDQTFIMEDGQQCNLRELSAYIEEKQKT